jgi:predicted metal-dependent hydrolase
MAAAGPTDPPPLDEEDRLITDHRFREAVDLFNAGEWYACHDGFEELWHETQGPMRPLLQGILQIAVAHLHLERGNRHGAAVLLGEGLGRLGRCGDQAAGLYLAPLRRSAADRLLRLQQGGAAEDLPLPRLRWAEGQTPPAAAAG